MSAAELSTVSPRARENSRIPSAPPRIRERVHGILTEFNASWQDVSGSSHRAKLVRCRMAISAALLTEFNWSHNRIGRFMNKDHTSIMYYIRKALPDRQPTGLRKLNPDQVREIRSRRTEASSALGREYGVTRDTITGIWRGDTWAWVD